MRPARARESGGERSAQRARPRRSAAALLTPPGVGALATLALALVQALVRHESAPHGDEQIYERMADDPLGTHTFPFGYRIGLPLAVHLLPLEHDVSFPLLAFACAGAAAGFLFALMRALRVPPVLAAATCVAFAVSPGLLIVLLRGGRSVDAATLLAMSAAALFAVRRRALPLCVALALGALVRESTLFMVPFAYAVWAERPFDRRALRTVAAAAAPALALYATLRLAIPTVGRDQVVGYGHGLLQGRLDVVRTELEDWPVALRRAFLAFGPLWLLYPLALRELRYARDGLVLLALCGVALTFALDWGRVLLLAAPVVYPAAAFALARRRALRIPLLAAWLAIAVAYAAYMEVHGVERNLDGASPPTYPLR